MVTLKNVTKTNNILSVDYFPEGNENDTGHIEFDIKSNKAIKTHYCKEDENSFLKTYSHKAVLAIKKLVRKNEFPETYAFMWY